MFSDFGATGILTALTQPSLAALREAIRETRRNTSKPFGVNITLLPSINPPDYEGYARTAVEEGVKIFETAGNNRTRVHQLNHYHFTINVPGIAASRSFDQVL